MRAPLLFVTGFFTLFVPLALHAENENSTTFSPPTRSQLEAICEEKLGILTTEQSRQGALQYRIRKCINSERRQAKTAFVRKQRMSQLSSKAKAARERFTKGRTAIAPRARRHVRQNLRNLRSKRLGGTKRLSTRARRAAARKANRINDQ